MARLWGLYRDRGRWVIRRGIERLPPAKFQRIRQDEALLREFVLRLNAPLVTKKAVTFRHAFISPELLDEYQELRHARVPTERSVVTEMYYLKAHFLDFFIGKLGMSNPIEWHNVHESKWATYLLSKDVPRAAHTKKLIVQAANRFVEWLHRKRPEEVPILVFTPLTTAVINEIEAQREIDGEMKDRKNIPDKDLTVIRKKCPDRLRPYFELGLAFGLRRGECLGLKMEDVREECLYLVRQLNRITPEPSYKPLKGRDARPVPFWFADGNSACDWIEATQLHVMNPTSLSKRWAKFMGTLGLDYDFHDLRHTFITKAMETQTIPDKVRIAAGHKHISTTMRYKHDTQALSTAPFVRRKEAA